MSRRLLLAVSRNGPWPHEDGYTVRVGELLRQVAREWDIVLVAPLRPGASAADEPLAFAERIVVPRNDAPGAFMQTDQAPLLAAAQAALARWQPAATLLWGVLDAVPLAPFQPALLDFIDSMTLTHLRSARHARRLGDRLRSLRDVLAWARAERSLVREAAASLVAGPGDASVLRRLAGRSTVHVIPNGVSLPPPAAPGSRSPEPSVIFTGVLGFTPNVDAAVWFARDVLPLARRVHPGARFVVAGRRPAPEVLALGELPGVSIEADVADMTACLRRAWIAVAPMRRGAGVKNKVLEAWAAGLPVVMTPIATNGLSLDAEAQAWVGRDAEELASRVVRLFSEPDALERRGRAARDLAERQHAWSSVGDRLLGVLDAVARRSETPRARRPETPRARQPQTS
jgi:glycosyltransferase involved in cell wall biosynthesis